MEQSQNRWYGLLLCVLVTSHATSVEKTFVIAGYLPSYRMEGWSKEIGPVTDVILFGMSMAADATFHPEILEKKHLAAVAEVKKKTGCRVLFTVGGWGKSEGFAKLVADENRMDQFVAAAKQFCLEQGLDGIDYDWEHPEGPSQNRGFTELVRRTQAAFVPARLLVTFAQAGWQDIEPEVYQIIDRVHLMSYDHNFPQATLEKAKQEVQKLIDAGCPSEKIALGLPFYGRNKQGDTRTYAQLLKGGNVTSDVVDGFAFNSPKTILEKMHFAKERSLAGVMIWEIGQDARGRRSLLDAMKKGVKDQ